MGPAEDDRSLPQKTRRECGVPTVQNMLIDVYAYAASWRAVKIQNTADHGRPLLYWLLQ